MFLKVLNGGVKEMKNFLKLTKLSKEEMGKVVGGMWILSDRCFCACKYANQGGSSTGDNFNANDDGGLQSPR